MSSKSDTIKIAYRVLFSIQLDIEGYNEIGDSSVHIVPDAATIDLNKKYKILNKKHNATSVVLIKTEAEGADKGKPEIMLKNNELFRFHVKIGNSFIRETHIGSYDFNDHILYASNLANNVVGTDVLLSKSLEIYNTSGTYEEGYLVQSAGKYYKAVQANGSANVHAVTDSAYWKEIGDAAYISQADLKLRSSLTNQAELDTVIVIEIIHSAVLSANYKLLDGALKCREVIYKIRLHT